MRTPPFFAEIGADITIYFKERISCRYLFPPPSSADKNRMKFSIKELSAQGTQILGAGWALPAKAQDDIKLQFFGADNTPVQCTLHLARHAKNESPRYTDQPGSAYLYTFSYDKSAPAPVRVVCGSIQHPTDTMTVGISEELQVLRTGRFMKLRKIGGLAKNFLLCENKPGYLKSIYLRIPYFTNLSYRRWLSKHRASEKDLKLQAAARFPHMPLISILVPVYNPKPEHLTAMIESVKRQSYGNWQLCLANGSGDNKKICRILHDAAAKDSRIKNGRLRQNRGISGNTNAALKMAEGEWIALADQDDLLAPDALYEYVAAINGDDRIDALYCDEDKLDDKKNIRTEPHFKSDFNIDLLTCNNYICHMFMVRKSIIDQMGGFNPEMDGAQDHDLTLRCVERCRKVWHIPRILYTWRSHAASTAGNAASKDYAFDAGVAAINAHYERMGIPGKASRAQWPGWYVTKFTLTETPLVSVLIPNKDHAEDLNRCIDSILTKATYANLELLIIENNSTEPETFALYQELQKRDPRIRVITWKGEFNYSAINNFGAAAAKGAYLLLLNNDTEVITPDLFESMLGYCMRKDVGAVGAKLLYGDNTVQHAGLLIGVMKGCHHVFLHYPKDEPGYMARACVSQDMSGVTGACLMVSKAVYDAVGGLDEEFVVAYNDVDFCLKLEQAGYLVVYDAFAQMYHYESKSRGYELSDEAQKRFDQEKERLDKKWHERLKADPYYNVNLSLTNGYYRLP